MSTRENILMGLLLPSVAASVALAATAQDKKTLFVRAGSISGFYAAWALFNKFTTKPYEKGHFAFLTCLSGCVIVESMPALGRGLASSGAAAAFIAFVIAGQRVLGWPASKLAHVSKKTLMWARVMQIYFVCSLGSWGYICYRLVTQE